MKSCRSWGYIATVIIGLALVSAALAERMTTFAWDSDPGWPNGTTIELCGNGPTCMAGITGASATLSLPVNHGDVIQGMARAIPPPGYQCGEPLAECPPSAWATVQATWPASPINGWARYERNEELTVAAPTFVAQYPTAFNSGTSPKTAMNAVAINAGDVLVGLVARENGEGSVVPALTENGSAAWVAQRTSPTINLDWTADRLSTYVATQNETITVTATATGAFWFGGNVVRFSGSDGVGASNIATGTSGSPSVSLTTTQANSAIVVLCGDWNAVSGTQTFTNNFSGTPTALTDYPGDNAHYGVAMAYFPDAGAAGSKTVGMSAPTGQKWTIIAIEVLGTAGAGPVTLTIQNSVHGHTAQALALTQAHTLALQAASHGHTSQALALTQANALAVQNSVHGHLAQALNLSASVTLQVDPTQHGHTAQLLDLLQANALAVQNSLHGHLAADIGLTQAHVLAPAGSVHGHSAAAPTLTAGGSLTVADAAHAHVAQGLSLTQAHALAVQGSAHGHSAQPVTLTQAHVLAPAASVHGHSAGAPTLTAGGSLVVADAVHVHVAQGISLAQAHALAVQGSAHGHSAQPVTLTQAHVLAPAGSVHGHTAQAPTLSTGLSLSPASAVHGHAVPELTLTQAHVLDLQGSVHGHTAPGVALIQGFALVVGDSVHAHTAAPLTLDLSFVLAIQTAVHQHHAAALELAAQVTLVVGNSLHQHLVSAASDLALPPGDRIFVVEAEDRIFVVIPDDRIFVV